MKKLTFILTICVLIISCSKQTDKKPTQQESNTTEEQPTAKNQNFAVVWKWITADTKLVEENVQTISSELTNLWKEGIVENAYFDTDAKINKLANFPNVVFFLKAESESQAESILNKLTVVTKNIASYKLYPVGLLWLDRNTEKIIERGMTRSFATVWTTSNPSNITEAITKAQSDTILELWNEGKIENVYFDIEGTQKHNSTTDFVFFVNANSKEEAEQLCKELPFFKSDIATYKIFESGVFWMGKNN